MTPRFPRHLRLPALPLNAYCVDCGSGAGDQQVSDTALLDRDAFERFAVRDDVPGALGVREVKFVITHADADTPRLMFMNSNLNPLHYYFVRDHLGADLSVADFNRVTYFTENRKFIVGNIVAYDNYTRPDGTPGLYALEFWPTDPMGAQAVALAYGMVRDAMPFARETLAFHPSGDIQEARLAEEADLFAAFAIPTVSTFEIFEDVRFNPLHLGMAIGTLRVIDGTERRPPAPTDIVIYDRLPNDLPLVAGVLSTTPQTALSHVNLRAQQNDIPNAYLRGAADDPAIAPLIGQIVRMTVTAEGVSVTPASAAERAAALAARRPALAQIPPRNLTPRAIMPLSDLRFDQADAFGAKATNVAELRRAIDPVYVPDGFAVPFSFYDTFMVANGLYDLIRAQMAAPDFADDTLRPDVLKSIRRAIKDAPMPTPLADQLDAMHRAFPAGTTPRCRSSANNEDLVGFTGAGLYDSNTHRLDEGHISKSIKQVWASLWNARAFEERDFYRIDHLSAAMGVLVHPNFDDERVNGVALTRNIYFPTFEGYFINSQVGEDLITNPESDAIAEEVLIIKDLNLRNVESYETIYVRRSTLVAPDTTVIARPDLMLLISQLKLIHDHFKAIYRRTDDPTFAMDIEFKFDLNGHIAIKQARPWTG